MNRPTTVALVLAGGQARRMGGGDKPLLMLRGRPMLDHVMAGLGDLPVAISANGDPARFAGFGVPVLPDAGFLGEGPLAGVLAGLEWAESQGAEALLTVPGDTPLLPHGLAERLAPAPGSVECAGQRHHLIAVWPVGLRLALRTFLSRPGSRQAWRFAEYIGMRYVAFPSDWADLFINVNTPDDLARVERMASDGAAVGRA